MTSHHRHLRTLGAMLLAALVVALVSGCGETVTEEKGVMGAAPTGPDEMAGAPTSGACYSMTYVTAQERTNSQSADECYDNNTQTYFVGLFPTGTTEPDEDFAVKKCRKELTNSALGVSRTKADGTIYSFVWFEPTGSQWDAGARWFRCDVVALLNGELKELENSNLPYYSYSDIENQYTRCLREIPEAGVPRRDLKLATTDCASKHHFRWQRSYKVSSSANYPGTTTVQNDAKTRCDNYIKTNRYAYAWPTQAEWSSGDRFTACFRLDSN